MGGSTQLGELQHHLLGLHDISLHARKRASVLEAAKAHQEVPVPSRRSRQMVSCSPAKDNASTTEQDYPRQAGTLHFMSDALIDGCKTSGRNVLAACKFLFEAPAADALRIEATGWCLPRVHGSGALVTSAAARSLRGVLGDGPACSRSSIALMVRMVQEAACTPT
eukprot:s5610_g10.t1